MMQLSNQAWLLTLAPFITVHLLILTPSSITTPGPITTLGPILQLSPILTLSSISTFPTIEVPNCNGLCLFIVNKFITTAHKVT